MSITANNYSKTTLYEYDKIGNITRAGDVTYGYDSLGQLVRVNDPQYGTTVYVYDACGNIKYVKSYDYTVSELGEVKDTKEYTYGNTSWKDLLTSYNGQAITYDAIGNPLSYGNMQFTWQMGRQLAKLEYFDPTDEFSEYSLGFKYDYNGLRTKKQYDIMPSSGSPMAYTIDYTYDANGRLIAQEGWSNDNFQFYYDESGSPIALEFNDEEYYYVTNLQGDIIAI